MFWNTFMCQTVPELLWPFWRIMRRVSSYFLTQTLTSCGCGLRRSYGFLRWRCRRSGVAEHEELVDRPGQRRERYVVRCVAIDLPAIFDEMWFLITGPMVLFQRKSLPIKFRKSAGNSKNNSDQHFGRWPLVHGYVCLSYGFGCFFLRWTRHRSSIMRVCCFPRCQATVHPHSRRRSR